MSLNIRALRIEKNNRCLLNIDTLDFAPAVHTAILGANGAGKTTLLNALAGGHSAVSHHDTPLTNFNHAQLAIRRAVFAQQQNIAFPLSVHALTALGREPYRGTPHQADDQSVIDYALAQFDLSQQAKRNSQTLSGGEQHRAHLARTLAQIMPNLDADLQDKWLLLDEPSNHLDLAHIHHLMHLVQQLTARGLTVISVLHDPALAMNYADHLLLLQHGTIQQQLSPRELANDPTHLSQLYGVNIDIHQHRAQYFLSIKAPE